MAPSGVLVVDAKRYVDASVRVRYTGGLFSGRREELLVRGRVRGDLVEGVARQVDVVRAALREAGQAEVPVAPLLCFVDGSFPFLESRLQVGATQVVTLKGLSRILVRAGGLEEEQRQALYNALGSRLTAM